MVLISILCCIPYCRRKQLIEKIDESLTEKFNEHDNWDKIPKETATLVVRDVVTKTTTCVLFYNAVIALVLSIVLAVGVEMGAVKESEFFFKFIDTKQAWFGCYQEPCVDGYCKYRAFTCGPREGDETTTTPSFLRGATTPDPDLADQDPVCFCWMGDILDVIIFCLVFNVILVAFTPNVAKTYGKRVFKNSLKEHGGFGGLVVVTIINILSPIITLILKAVQASMSFIPRMFVRSLIWILDDSVSYCYICGVGKS